MSETAGYACPHCAAINAELSEFCSSCGMAMPSMTPSGPRIITSRQMAVTSAGQRLQSDELLRTARRAARSLLTIGILYLALTALTGFVIYNLIQMGRTAQTRNMVFLELNTASTLVVGAIFIGMYFWAKISPLSATIVGLVVYILKWVLDIGMQVILLKNGNSQNTIANYGVLRIITVVYLVSGVMAAIKHRQLEREQLNAGAPMPVLPVE